MRETRARSLAKSISWRVGGSLTTVALVWLFTREVDIALAVGGAEVLAKMAIFYLHERAWAAVAWGRGDGP
ncbi:MAG: hypothetical protein AMXMBFR53_38740 [Gemmatimonadota bacterium]